MTMKHKNPVAARHIRIGRMVAKWAMTGEGIPAHMRESVIRAARAALADPKALETIGRMHEAHERGALIMGSDAMQ
jgi:hypothetical protein